jgi:hypothetical protein
MSDTFNDICRTRTRLLNVKKLNNTSITFDNTMCTPTLTLSGNMIAGNKKKRLEAEEINGKNTT